FIPTVNNIIISKWFLYFSIVVLSYLMVSNLRMMALKFSDYKLKNNLSKLILLIVAIVAALFLQWIAVPVVFVFYILLSLIQKKVE
ncbi:MAG: CDP-alcohol phosphatidyltransferase family protein, partial [Ginsengibacter sp.]